ncbi:MAG: glycerophosphodiester phosphodiesterase [Planctomycetes bacterium]|nr:glycerophosphodiester phosphodiesterase [Planctomycetota bacterium]
MKHLSPFVMWFALLHAAPSSAVEIIAHRGASYDAPENTMAAFTQAWVQSADAVELDIYLTKDGQIVALHDKTTQRTAGVELVVAESTLAQLQELDVGRWKDLRWAGQRIPSLRAALSTVPRGLRLFIEIKCGPEVLPELERIVTTSGEPDGSSAIIGFNYDTMRLAKQRLPKLPVYWIVSPVKGSEGREPTIDALIEKAKAARLDGLDLNFNFALDEAAVARVHDAGLKLYTWTVNDPEVARRLKGIGVDGITTDRPAYLIQALKAAPAQALQPTAPPSPQLGGEPIR